MFGWLLTHAWVVIPLWCVGYFLWYFCVGFREAWLKDRYPPAPRDFKGRIVRNGMVPEWHPDHTRKVNPIRPPRGECP